MSPNQKLVETFTWEVSMVHDVDAKSTGDCVVSGTAPDDGNPPACRVDAYRSDAPQKGDVDEVLISSSCLYFI